VEVDEWIYHGLYEQPCERIMGEKTGYGHRAVFPHPFWYAAITHIDTQAATPSFSQLAMQMLHFLIQQE